MVLAAEVDDKEDLWDGQSKKVVFEGGMGVGPLWHNCGFGSEK